MAGLAGGLRAFGVAGLGGGGAVAGDLGPAVGPSFHFGSGTNFAAFSSEAATVFRSFLSRGSCMFFSIQPWSGQLGCPFSPHFASSARTCGSETSASAETAAVNVTTMAKRFMYSFLDFRCDGSISGTIQLAARANADAEHPPPNIAAEALFHGVEGREVRQDRFHVVAREFASHRTAACCPSRSRICLRICAGVCGVSIRLGPTSDSPPGWQSSQMASEQLFAAGDVGRRNRSLVLRGLAARRSTRARLRATTARVQRKSAHQRCHGHQAS